MTQHQETSVVGSRIIYQNFIGTIRYEGPVAGTEGVWYGIEWDNPQKGKHDGCFQGVRYFGCELHEGAPCASFVRPGKVDFGVDIMAALFSKYCEDKPISAEERTIYTNYSKIPVHFVGESQIISIQSQLKNLICVGLNGCKISIVETPSPSSCTVCPNLQSLDLSNNLISSWLAVENICKNFPSLEKLDLSGNIFHGTQILKSQVNPSSFQSISSLSLNSTFLNFGHLIELQGCFSNLKELHFCSNRLQKIQIPPQNDSFCLATIFPKLETLDLQHNQLDWNEIIQLGSLKTLKCLILCSNKISSISYAKTPSDSIFPILETLSLSDNLVSDWTSINELNSFPSLRVLNVKNNPIASHLALKDGCQLKASDVRTQTIARVEKLVRLNNSDVHPRERIDSEVYYLKTYVPLWTQAIQQSSLENAQQVLDPSPAKDPIYESFRAQHPRFLNLMQKHKYEVDIEKIIREKSKCQNPSSYATNTLLLLNFRIQLTQDDSNGFEISKKVPASMTIAKLRVLVQSLIKKQLIRHGESKTDSKLITSENLILCRKDQISGQTVCLEDDFKPLSYYSIMEENDIISVTYKI